MKTMNLTKMIGMTVLTMNLTACLNGGGGGGGFTSTPSTDGGNVTEPSNPGTISNALEAAGCTVAQLVSGIRVSCNGTTADLSNGANGANGAQGIQGLKGDKGDKGDTGAQGPQGLQGPQGIQGPQGPAGTGGASWVVRDANGLTYPEMKYIGPVGTIMSHAFYSTQRQATVVYDDTGYIRRTATLYYTQSDCTGEAMISVTGLYSNQLIMHDPAQNYTGQIYKTYGTWGSKTHRSILQPEFGCTNTNGTTRDMIRVSPSSMPTGFPISYPLPISITM